MADKHAGPPPGLHLYTRDGFTGSMAVAIRPFEVYEYTTAEGPHAPRRIALDTVAVADADDPLALPTVVATSRAGAMLSVSRRRAATPFIFRNTEADELHFVQEGTFRYTTDFGVLEVGPGDFVWLGRTVTYEVEPTGDESLRVIVETPEQLGLNPPAPFGMLNLGRDVRRPTLVPPPQDAPRELWLKAFDGITRFTTVHDPLACRVIVDGTPPAWALNLAAIATLSYAHGGPPAQFLQTPSTDLMFYTLSSRPPAGRPPQHHNADYDELIFYVRGPGAYGAIDEPGALAIIPKGVTHWGPEEHVPEGYLAWLLESRGTMRLTDAGAAASVLMETGTFGHLPS